MGIEERIIEQFMKTFPNVLRESNSRDEIIENTTLDPDSPEAWYNKDETGPESDIVRVGNFTWHRHKSNENVMDFGDGKGISFFYARYAFEDKNKKTASAGFKRNKVIGKITNQIYAVIETIDERDLTRIISAWAIDDPHSEWVRFYYQNNERARKSIETDGKPIYKGASDEQSEKYVREALEY